MIPSSLLSANAIPISRSEKLRLTFYNPHDGISYQVNIRYQIADSNGKISDNFETFLLEPSVQGTDRVLSLTDGLLIAVTVTASATGLQAGEVYAVIALQYGDLDITSNLLQLVAGYITGNAPLNYPLTESRDINQTNPAAITQTFADGNEGQELSLQFEPNYYTKIIGFNFLFHTDANVANRQLTIIIGDSNGEVFRTAANEKVPAGTNALCYSFNGNIPATLPPNTRYYPIQPMPFVRGLTIETVTGNIQAQDIYTGIIFRTEKYVAT